jgi:hypothetical protein
VIPYFRGTSLPWYAASASNFLGRLGSLDILSLCKTLSINIVFNFAIFLFLPLRNCETILLTAPLYMIFIVGYAAGYTVPLSPISWHANALYPLILIGYMKELSNYEELTAKFTLLKLSFLVTIFLCIVVQASKNYNNKDLYLLATKYSRLKEDFDKIQDIRTQTTDGKLLVSFQLGKYFADRQDVNLLENRSDIGDQRVKYILYYGGEMIVPIDNHNLETIKQKFRMKLHYKDILVFERTLAQNFDQSEATAPSHFSATQAHK